MITNKDIRVENGNLVLNGDKHPLDGQSPEAIMAIVEDNSDTTPTENSDAPITSGGVFTALAGKQDTLTFDTTPTDESTNPVTSGGVFTALAGKQDTLTFDTTPTDESTNPVTSGGLYNALGNLASGKADIFTASSGGVNQTITIGTSGTENHSYLLAAGYWTNANDNYVFGLVLINSSNNAKFVSLAPSSSIMTVSVSFADGDLSLTFGSDPYSKAQIIKLH